MLVFLLFVLGLAVGSFLNVLIDRIPQGQSPFKGRSYCDKCKKTLKWYDMIPVLSFLILKGKCRYCRTHISFYYPLVEFITGVMFVIVFAYVYGLRSTDYGLSFSILNSPFGLAQGGQFSTFLYYLFILPSFIVIFFTDLKYGIIPDKIVYPSVVIFTIYHLSILPSASLRAGNFPFGLAQGGQFSIFNYLLSGIGAFIFFLVLFLITKGKGMGFGDVKLAFLLGLFLGFPKILAALYLAFLTGALIGSILIIWRKKKLKGGTIPFGPFLIIGTVLSLFFGEKILRLASLWLSF